MAKKQQFLISDAISFGWDAMKKNFLLFLFITLTIFGVEIFMHLTRHGFILFILTVIGLLALIIIKLGILRISLDIIDKKKVDYNKLFSQASLFPDFLVASILYLLMVIAGLILFIVPGIIWAIKYQFYGYYIVDKKLSPFEALKHSGKITYGHKWKLLGLTLTLIGINILGILCLLVGLFATIPTTYMAETYVYRLLDKK